MSDMTQVLAGQIDNPYVGPRAFLMNEILYGRERESSALFNLLIAERIVLLYSPSGAGKTSLIQAKLVPQLQTRRFRVLGPMRVGLERVTIADVTQSHSDENQYLASALQSLEAHLPVEDQFGPADLAGLDLAGYLRKRGWLGKGSGRLALIFDQFEEILTVNPIDREGKRAFFEHIGDLLRESDEGQPIWALFSMREEYIAPLEQYLRPVPTRLGNTLRIDRLDADNAELAIQKPAESRGIPFTQDALKQLVQDLSKEKVQLPDGHTETQIGAYIEPVQLQVVCRRLWEKLPPNTTSISQRELKLLGEDVSSALGDYYNDSVKSIATAQGVPERDLRRWVEQKLITDQGIRSQALKGTKDPELERAISALEDAHLIRSETRRNATWYELSHDRLVEPIRQANKTWSQLNETPFQHQAALWSKEGRPRGLLLSSDDLEEAEAWADAHFVELERHEKDFLATCRKAKAQHLQTDLWIAVSAVVVVGLVALGAFYLYSMACQQARIANAIRLATQSLMTLEKYPQRSLLLAVEAVATTGRAEEPRAPDAETALRQALSSTGGQALSGHEESITAVAFSPNSRLLVTGSGDKTVRLWDLKDPAAEPRVLRGHDGSVFAVAVSPDGRWLVTGGGDKTARLWNLSAKDPGAASIVLRGHEGYISAVTISPDSRWLVTGSSDKTARLWDLTAEDPASTSKALSGHVAPITAVAISADNHWLVTLSYDKIAFFWDLTVEFPNAERMVLRGREYNTITVVAISPDSQWLVTGGSDKTARLWDLTAKGPVLRKTLRGHTEGITAVAVSSDGRSLVTGSGDNTARLWDLTATDPAEASIVLRGHEGYINPITFSPDGRWLVTIGNGEKMVRLWDLTAKDLAAEPKVLRGHQDGITAVAISPDNHWLVTSSQDKWVRLWDLTARVLTTERKILCGLEHAITAVAISPDSHWLVTGSEETGVRLWDLRIKDQTATHIVLRGQEGSVSAIAFSSDSRWLVTGSRDNRARLWDLTAKDPAGVFKELRGHEGGITAVAISPDSRWLVTGSSDKTARLWDLSAMDPSAAPAILKGDEDGGITVLAISPNSHWLVTGSSDGTARLWDLTARNPASTHRALSGHVAPIKAMAISPDNRWLVTGSQDKTARIWDLRCKDPAAAPIVLRGHEDIITAVAISSDNRWLTTGSDDKTVRLWNLSLDELVGLACLTAARSLTKEEWEQYMPGQKYHETCPEFPGMESKEKK